MVRTAINLYSVRDLDLPMGDLLERVAAAGYDGVQFSGGLRDAAPAEVADAVADLGLGVTPAHVGIEEIAADAGGVVERYESVGSDGLVVPWLDAEHFASESAVEATAERLDTLAETLASRGFALHYHNHDHEFTDLDGTTGYDALAAASSVLLEVDVGWVHTAGRDPVALLERYADRVDVVHMKDMAGGAFRELGEGDVDLRGCAEAARAADAEWLVYEHDEPSDPAASIDTGAAVLDRLLGRR